MNDPEQLYQFIRSQLSESASPAEIEAQVRMLAASQGIDASVVSTVLNRISEPEPVTPPPLPKHQLPTIQLPRLLVDWGELPRVGYQVRPEFSLLCPAYKSQPEISISVDRELDHDADDPRRRPQTNESGFWSFHVPFRMTSDGMDCRPGHYLMGVEVAFRDVPPELPRFYRCQIRLNVSNTNVEEHGVLEIDGDGQSIVNLQGYNLKQFSKVVLKGGQDSVINLQNGPGSNDASLEPPAIDKPVTTFEYQLKIDHQKQARLPIHVPSRKPRAYLDEAGFFFEDGRRSIVVSRPRITFGRSRDNDVVVRFLPPGEENDGHSRNISRTHFIAELTADGIELRDQSHSGMEVNYSVVRSRQVVPASHAGDVTHIELGVTGTVSKKFAMEMLLFAPNRRDHRDELGYWDELYCEIVGGRLSRVAREALDVSINAVRYDRAGNLSGEESYVHLLREALLGGSPSQAAIVLRESGPRLQARLLHIDRSFWLEPLPGCQPISIDDVALAPRSLHPLSPGMELRFGSELVRFDRPSQLYLD